jgi:hypothetical protein
MTLREDLWDLPLAGHAELLDQSVVRFAAFVGDLPASERFHHAGDYGLLDHSLEVAARVTRALSDRSFPGSLDPGDPEADLRAWHYGAFVCGLLHDVGKVYDLEVRAAEGADPWNPMVEPLLDYLARHGVRETGPSRRHHRAGRGVAHQWRSPHLFLDLLPVEARRLLGRRLVLLMDAVEGIRSPARWIQAEPAAQIVKTVHWADIESAGADFRKRKLNSGANPPEPCGTGGGKTELSGSIPWMDLDRVFREFREALLEAVRGGKIPLNQPQGLCVGSRFLYLDYSSGFERVLDLMKERGSELEARHQEEAPVVRPELYMEVTPEGRVIEALRWKKALPLSTEEGFWTLRGVLETDQGTSSIQPWVVLDRSQFPGEFPHMPGRVLLGEGAGDPGGDAREGQADLGVPDALPGSDEPGIPPPIPSSEEGKGVLPIAEGPPEPTKSEPPAGGTAPASDPSFKIQALSFSPAPAEDVPESAERDLQERRGRLFERLMASLGKLLARREEVSTEALRLHQEFRRTLPHARLLLYLKRRPKKPTQLPALYWGCHAPLVPSSPPAGRGVRKRGIKHLSSELSESLIYRYHATAQKDLYLTFDRRRKALNESTHALSVAIGISFSRCYSVRKAAEHREKLDWRLPPGAAGGLPTEGEFIARHVWWLLTERLEAEREFLGLEREVHHSLGVLGFRLKVEVPKSPWERLTALWYLPCENSRRDWLRPEVVQALKLSDEHRADLLRLEGARRKLVDRLGRLFWRVQSLEAGASQAIKRSEEELARSKEGRADPPKKE